MSKEKPDILDFQKTLLTLLDQQHTPEEIFARLQTDPVFFPFQEYLQTVELPMLEVASLLVQKWGKKEEIIF